MLIRTSVSMRFLRRLGRIPIVSLFGIGEHYRVGFDVISRMTTLTNLGDMLFFYDHVSFCFVKRSVPFISRFLVSWIVHEVGCTLSGIADHQQRVGTQFTSLLLYRVHQIVPLFLCPPSFDDCNLRAANRFPVKNRNVALGTLWRSIRGPEFSNGHLRCRRWIYPRTRTYDSRQDGHG